VLDTRRNTNTVSCMCILLNTLYSALETSKLVRKLKEDVTIYHMILHTYFLQIVYVSKMVGDDHMRHYFKQTSLQWDVIPLLYRIGVYFINKNSCLSIIILLLHIIWNILSNHKQCHPTVTKYVCEHGNDSSFDIAPPANTGIN